MRKTSKNKKVTLDDLAIMVKRGFDVMDERFKQVDTKIGVVEKNSKSNFVELNKRFDDMGHRLAHYTSEWDRENEKLRDWVSDLDTRVNRIEDKLVRK